jgi:hypothetical protein
VGVVPDVLGELGVLLGAVQGTLGRALVPFAARALLEDGARWEWLGRNATAAPTGDSMRAIVAESKRHIRRVRDTMLSAGAQRRAVDDLIGVAGNLLESDPGEIRVPPTDKLLAVAYPNPSGVDSARVMYSVLSQFVHATPLSLLHLERDAYPSVTAPIYAIAVESACRGFFNVARTTLSIACGRDTELDEALVQLARSLGDVSFAAARWHCLG